jgi:hypothetical protein
MLGNDTINQWDYLGMAPNRWDIERGTREARNLLEQVRECYRTKPPECCTDLYDDYLSRLAQLIRDVGEFYEDQWWVNDAEQAAFEGVYALPMTVDGAAISREQLDAQRDAVRAAGESVGKNLFNEHGTEIEHGANFAGGFSDGVLFGAPGAINNVLGRGWADTSSGYYTGGLVTGIGATAITGAGTGIRGYRAGREIAGTSGNWRIAPFGNRTGHPTGRFPHYHRRGLDSSGNVRPGQGIGRHRPWDRRSTDRGFRDRF